MLVISIKFAGYVALILKYKVWKFGSNQYSHGWNTEFFLGDCFLLAHPVYIFCVLLRFLINTTSAFVSVNGSEYLTEQGIVHDTDWDFWQNIFALGVIIIGLLFISYVQLRLVKKLK